jgi:hypothetical protein
MKGVIYYSFRVLKWKYILYSVDCYGSGRKQSLPIEVPPQHLLEARNIKRVNQSTSIQDLRVSRSLRWLRKSPLKVNRRFGVTCRLHLQGRRIRPRAHQGNWQPRYPRNVADIKQASGFQLNRRTLRKLNVLISCSHHRKRATKLPSIIVTKNSFVINDFLIYF